MRLPRLTDTDLLGWEGKATSHTSDGSPAEKHQQSCSLNAGAQITV
jgi:hypothetical protein